MNIKLNSDEGIILETEDASWENGEKGYSLGQLVLTNKNLYVVSKFKPKLFAKPTIETITNPLSEVKFIDGRYLVDLEDLDDDTYEEPVANLRIQFLNCYYVFLFARNETHKWYNALLEILNRQ